MRPPSPRSQRTAILLLAVMAVLIGIHFAYRNPPVALSTPTTSVISLTVKGRVMHVGSRQLTVTLEDPHGTPTGMLRQILLTSHTSVIWPGRPAQIGSAGFQLLRPGYQVVVLGTVGAQHAMTARTIAVSYPSVAGLIKSLLPGRLSLRVPGQRTPMTVVLTSRTAIYVPRGQWNAFKTGAVARIYGTPGTNGVFTATKVIIDPPSSGS